MFQVCEICGDAGFPDLLFICKKCKSTQHFYCSYCMSKQPDSDGEAWSCESCMLTQETIPGTVVSSLHSEIEQSQILFSKCQKECRDSHPTIKKQAFEGSNGTDSLNKNQELDNLDVTESLLARKKKVIESSNKTDSLPNHKEKTLGSYSGIECLFINKKKHIGSSTGMISPSNNNKQLPGSSNATGFSQSTENQVLKNSNGANYSLTRRKQFVGSSDGIPSLPSCKKKEPEISNGSKKEELQSSRSISHLPIKKQLSECSNHIDLLLIRKKEVVNTSFGNDSLPASEKHAPESLKDTNSLSASKNKPLGSVNRADSPSVGKKRLLENTDSLPASKKQAPRSSSVAHPPLATKKQATESSNNTDFSKERSKDRPSSRESTIFKAQMMPALVASGSKSAMVEKTFDSPCPNALDLAKVSLRSSEEIASECDLSSLNRNSSKFEIAAECELEHEKSVPADSIKSLESNKDGSKSANKVFDKYKSSETRESLSPMEVDTQYSSGLLGKGNSSGYDVVSAGVTNNCKEIGQSLIGKSMVKDTITSSERDFEINNGRSERNSISHGTDERKLDANAVLWNNYHLRCLDEHDKEKIDHSMRNFSEINISSPSELEKRSLSSCKRDFIAGNMLLYTNCSSGTSFPQQLQLTIPQSLILWNGTFNVEIAIGHAIYGGIQAHPSTTASPKVYEISKQFGSQLYLEQVHRAEAWPRSFEQSPPTDSNVGLYFFPEDGKFERSFATLVEYINKHDLAMRMHLDGAELLIYSSIQLPKHVQRIFGKFYLWGVFRRADKSTTGHKLHEASMQHDHVRAVMFGSVAPSRSNMVGISNVHKNDVKVEMDFEMEGKKDVAVAERPLRMDFQSARLPPVCISPVALPLDSEDNHFQISEMKVDDTNTGRCWISEMKGDDTNTSRCALYGQDRSLLGIRSMVSSENSLEVASRRCSGKYIDWSHEQYHSSHIEKVDGQSALNSLDSHILHGSYSGKSRESMHDRSNECQNHEEMNTGESTSRFVAPNRIPFLEEKDEIDLLTLQPQARILKSGFAATSCPTDRNSQLFSSNHLHKKHDIMHFQGESNANAGAVKQKDLKNQHHVFPTRDLLDEHQKSRQSSLSSGDSDISYGNNNRFLSQPTSERKFYEYEDINKFSRGQSFKDHVGTKTKFCNEEDRSNEDTKLVMERYKEKSHGLWQTKYGRSYAQIEKHRGCKERNHKHWQMEGGRRHGEMEKCRSHIINHKVNSSDSYSDKGEMLEETSMNRDSISYCHEKTSMHRLSSNNHQIHVNNFVDKDKVYMVDNFKSAEKDYSVTRSREGLREGLDRYQVVIDRQSPAPLHTATDETVENNSVSEISNAASTLESPGQIYPQEIVPHLVEPDLPASVNSRTEHTAILALERNSSLSHGNLYVCSSPGQADQEPVEYLHLFPLEEENLGATKNIVKELEDINLDLSLGRGSVKNTLKITDGQVCLNGSNLEDPDVNPCLGVSLPVEKEKKRVT